MEPQTTPIPRILNETPDYDYLVRKLGDPYAPYEEPKTIEMPAVNGATAMRKRKKR